MTPIFNEIGTIAETRISPKRLVVFRNDLHRVVAEGQAYKTGHISLGMNRGY